MVVFGLVAGLLTLLPPAPAHAAARCVSGTDLAPGTTISSPPVNGRSEYQLRMQGDGDLAVYRFKVQTDGNWHALWHTRTSGNWKKNYASIQSRDGNLVVYASPGHRHPVWAAFAYQPNSPRPRSPGARLCVQTDGNLVIYSASRVAVWATMTTTRRGATWGATHGGNGFPPGQCTWYVDEMFHAWNRYGLYVGWGGDARYWARNAAAVGWSVGAGPRAGSIAVFQPGVDGAGAIGHVAWVEQFYPNRNQILVSEMHFPNLGRVDYRLVSPAVHSGLRYIYVSPGR